MADELKTTVINMKSLSQNIPDPVVIGAGDANGRTLRIIFTQEAAAQMTENTKVYLSWYHQGIDVKGYNVFTHITDDEDENFPPTWEIKYPKSMLYEGDVLACIQLVDNISIATSTNFMIHVLFDPNDGSRYTATDDFSEFQRAVVTMSTLSDEMRRQMVNQKIEFEDMQLEFMDVRQVAQDANSASEQAREIAEQALQVAQNALNTIVDLTDVAREARDTVQEVRENVTQIEERVTEVEQRLNQNDNVVNAIKEVADSALEIARAIDEKECGCGGVDEQEMSDAINAATQELTSQIQDTESRLSLNLNTAVNNLNDEIDRAKADVIAQYQNDLINAFTVTEFI